MPPAALEPLLRSPTAYAFAAVLGALFGSFANVVIYRLPRGQSIVSPGSHCFACAAPVRWFDNLPIVSWLVLRGRCRRCGASFSPRYLLVEAATAILSVAAWHYAIVLFHPDDEAPIRLARFGVYALFLLALVVITFIDLDTKKILDRITYPAIPLFFLFGWLLGDVSLLDRGIGVVAGYGVVRLISDGYYHLTGREGLGYGDGKLLAVVGALLGWRAVIFSLFAGSLLGTMIAVPVLLLTRGRRDPAAGATPLPTEPPPPPTEPKPDDGQADHPPSIRHMELPFGPFLAAGAVVFLFLQDALTAAFSLG